jgi:hypothetical protein
VLDRFRRAIAPKPPDRGALPGLPWEAMYPPHKLSPFGLNQTYNPPRGVAASTSSVILALANPARKTLVISNDGTGNLYVALSPYASTSGYTVRLGPQEVYILETPNTYQGAVAGVWDVANGFARVTESPF